MGSDLRTCKAVEKGFSSYIKLCLRHASRDYFRMLYRDFFHVRPPDEVSSGTNTALNIWVSAILTIKDFAVLSQAIQTLSSSEKKVLHLKFFQDKTDKEIAQSIGVTRQAISKSKLNVLLKLKSHLEKNKDQYSHSRSSFPVGILTNIRGERDLTMREVIDLIRLAQNGARQAEAELIRDMSR